MANGLLAKYDLAYSSDKTKVFNTYCDYMFARTQSMFVYTNLPDTIPQQWLEQYLQRNGSCIITSVNGKLYALLGNAGGEYDEYYQPTLYTVANPYLKISKTYTIGEDCIYCKNTFDGVSLTPLISRYCGLMTENLLTTRLSDINMRMINLLSASDDNTLLATRQYLKDLEQGKLGVIGETPFFDGIKLQSNSIGSGDYMIQFIELQQYLKGSFYNELGINANFNMKREALSGQELAMNDDMLMPLIDNMLAQRRDFVSQLNEKYNLDISVDYGSTWHSNTEEKVLVAQEDFSADGTQSASFAGDEQSQESDASLNKDVSQLNQSSDIPKTSGDSTDNQGSISDDNDDMEDEARDNEREARDEEQGASSEESEASDDDADEEDADEEDVAEEDADEEGVAEEDEKKKKEENSNET